MEKEKVKHIADLARLKLTDREIEEITPQLSEIFGYVEQLKEVNTTNIEPTAQVSGQENIFRSDVKENCPEDERISALHQSPQELEEKQIKVKKVI